MPTTVHRFLIPSTSIYGPSCTLVMDGCYSDAPATATVGIANMPVDPRCIRLYKRAFLHQRRRGFSVKVTAWHRCMRGELAAW